MRTAMNAARAIAVFALVLAGSAPLTAAAGQSTFDVTVLAGACASCHGTDGRSPGGIPSIAGRPESVLLGHLRAFKSETPPPGTTIMDRLTRGFSDEELQALAHHFSQIKAQSSQGAR